MALVIPAEEFPAEDTGLLARAEPWCGKSVLRNEIWKKAGSRRKHLAAGPGFDLVVSFRICLSFLHNT